MEMIGECLVAMGFYGVLGTQLRSYLRGQFQNARSGRWQALLIGMGFLFGLIWKVSSSPVSWTLPVYYLGILLAYTTLAASKGEETLHE